MDVNWSSDGADVTITAPTQQVAVTLITASTTLSARFTNNDPDVITFDQNGPVKPSSLELRLGSFIPKNIPIIGTNPENYFTAGDYFLELSFSGIDMRAADDTSFTKVEAGFTLVEDPAAYLYADDVIVSEGAGTAKVVVALSQAAASTVTVNYQTAADSATTADFTATSGTLTIAAGDREGVINVPLTNDTVNEGVEAFTVNLSNASGATLLVQRTAVGD